MLPRMRTVGGCWAHAADASTAKAVSDAISTRGINEEIFGMASPPQAF
jgi:hypothetical protein